MNKHKRNSTTDDGRRQLQAHVRQHASGSLRVLTNADQRLPGPLNVLGCDLDPDRACNGIVTSGKATHSDQILESLAFNDIPNALGVQSCFRQGDHDGIAGAEDSDEVVVQRRSICCLTDRA